MAFVTTEDQAIRLGGFTPALIFVKGTYANSGGGTGGIVSPGYTNSSGTLTATTSAAVGGRTIIADWFTTIAADATTIASAVAYDTTRDRDEATITTVANTSGRYFLLCLDNGS